MKNILLQKNLIFSSLTFKSFLLAIMLCIFATFVFALDTGKISSNASSANQDKTQNAQNSENVKNAQNTQTENSENKQNIQNSESLLNKEATQSQQPKKNANALDTYYSGISTMAAAKNIYDPYISFYKDSYVFEDTTKSQNYQKILNVPFSNWKIYKTDFVNYRISNSEFWFYNKFNLLNSGINYLTLGSNLQDYIDAYILDADNKVINHFIAGDRSAYKRTDHSLLFNFKLPTREEAKYPIGILIKLSSHDGIYEVNTANISTSSEFANLFDTEIFIYAILFGITIIFIFFGLSLFLMIKERIYFYYALYVLSAVFWFLIHSGIFELFVRVELDTKYFIINLSLTFMLFFLCMFFIRFIDLKRNLPKFNRYLIIYLDTVLMVSVLLAIFDNRILFFTLVFVLFGIGAFAYLLGLAYMFKRDINTNFVRYTFLILSFVFLVFGIYFGINYFFTNEVIIKYGANFAIAVNFMLITLAIGYKVQILEGETNRTEDEISFLLNKEIEERTKDLVEVNKRLNFLSIQDELTRVGNRRYYNQQINLALNQVEKNEISLGFAIIDIDYFKLFNDFYGHMAGDKILVRVAEEIKNGLYNTSAMVFRLGGEEFGVIMPNFTFREISNIFNKLQKNIENLRIANEKTPLGILTISSGVVFADLPIGVTEESLYSAADSLLYEAKNSGRNKTVISFLSDMMLDNKY